jgi:hypothetical protein
LRLGDFARLFFHAEAQSRKGAEVLLADKRNSTGKKDDLPYLFEAQFLCVLASSRDYFFTQRRKAAKAQRFY